MFSLWFDNEKGLFNAQTDCLSLRKIPHVKRLKRISLQFCILDAFALTNKLYSHLLMRRANSDGDVHRAGCQKSGHQDLHWPVATNYFFCPRCWLRLFRCPRCLPLWGARSAEGGRRASHWGGNLSHAISIHLNPSLEQVIWPYGHMDGHWPSTVSCLYCIARWTNIHGWPY